MKKTLFVIFAACIVVLIISCGNQNSTPTNQNAEKSADADKPANGNPSYDPHRGEGKFTKVEISPTINTVMASSGNKVFGVKCSGCHKLTEEKLVGPGWKGITKKYSPEWILNFITNTDVMLDKDPKAQALLEICLVRMPNQNLTDEDARALYELQRMNDNAK